MSSALHRVLSFVGLLVVAAACQPEIGDECDISNDCSQQGDRQCDTTQPGGYCTKFNCEPGGCPEEAICVAFSGSTPEYAECDATNASLLRRRTYCLRSCGGNDDCRSGYECGDVGESPNAWGAAVVEEGSGSARVCIVPVEAVPIADAHRGVCAVPEATAQGQSGASGEVSEGAAGAVAAGGSPASESR